MAAENGNALRDDRGTDDDVLRMLRRGTAAEHEPDPLYASHALAVVGVGLALFVVATVIALLVSRRITRLGRPSTLRWAEQG